MKQLYIQATTQHPKNIEDAFSVKNQSNIRRNSNRRAILNPKHPGGAFGTDKHEWQGTGLCKGPPGRPRSPGIMFPEHPPARLPWPDGPDEGATPDRVPNPVGGNTPGNAEIQIFKNNKFNYYSQSNFTIMKKYLFILILAVFASVTVAFGQVNTSSVAGSAPNTSNCTNDALHPIAGKPYSYQLTANPNGGQYTWYATKELTFVSTTASVTTLNTTNMLVSPTITASNNYGSPGSGDVVTITWSSSILANTVYNTNPTFVVGYYDANGVAGICADNLKVYQLDPKNGFIVDIKPYDIADLTTSLAYASTASQCFDDVREAKWVATQVEYDYGTNLLVYEVVAANFSDEWKPQFLLTGQDGTQSVTIQWTYDEPDTWGAGTVWHADTETATTSVTDTSNGVSIYVRVTIGNNNYQGLSDQQLTLAVAGTNKEGLWDVNNSNCNQPTDFSSASADDQSIQWLKKRPTMTPGTTGTPAPNTTLAPTNAVPNP